MAISLVQSNNAQENNTTNTITVTLGSATTANNLIIVVITNYSNANTNPGMTFTDSKSNSWTPLQSRQNTLNWGFIWMYYAIISNAGSSHSFTATCNVNPSFNTIAVYEYSGVDTVTPLETSAVGTGTGTNAVTANITTTGTGDLFFCGGTEDNAVSGTAGNSFTNIDEILTGQDLHTQSKIGNAQTTAGKWTWASSSPWALIVGAFNAASTTVTVAKQDSPMIIIPEPNIIAY